MVNQTELLAPPTSMMLCVESTVHSVNSNRVQILGKIRLDWFVISLNLEIGFLRVKLGAGLVQR